MPFIKGYIQTEEQKRKIVETRIKNGSYVAWNKGKKMPSLVGNPNGFKKNSTPWNKGKKGVMPIPWNKGGGNYTPEMIKRMRDSHKGQIGEKASNWQGGKTSEVRAMRASTEYKLWRDSVFARDNWTCQKTGVKGGMMHAHHIKSFSDFKELRTSIENGITLSRKSHKEFHKKYGMKHNTPEQLIEFLNNK